MDYLGLRKFLFSSKSRSSGCSSSSRMKSTQGEDLEQGLKALTSPTPNLNPCCISRADILPSMASSSSSSSSSSSFSILCQPNKIKKTKNDFPPPIHVLSGTENAPCHMPWVLKRCYLGGRLVMHEVPVKRHEYFKAHRSEGRLILKMMYVKDYQSHSKSGCEDGPSTSTITSLEDKKKKILEENMELGNANHNADSCTLFVTSLGKDEFEENNANKDIGSTTYIPSAAEYRLEDTKSHIDGRSVLDLGKQKEVEVSLEDTKSDDERNDLYVKKEKEVEFLAEDKLEHTKSDYQRNDLDVNKKEIEIPTIDHHMAIKKVLNRSSIYSSSLPEGRVPCLPKDFFRIGTPTIRPIYS